MPQCGFFEVTRRYERLDAEPDPLVALNKPIPRLECCLKLDAVSERARLHGTA
jgi:hypothetical protein